MRTHWHPIKSTALVGALMLASAAWSPGGDVTTRPGADRSSRLDLASRFWADPTSAGTPRHELIMVGYMSGWWHGGCDYPYNPDSFHVFVIWDYDDEPGEPYEDATYLGHTSYQCTPMGFVQGNFSSHSAWTACHAQPGGCPDLQYGEWLSNYYP